MKSRDYWKKRTLENEAYANSVAEREIIRQQRLYKQAYKELKGYIDGLYSDISELGITPSRTQLWQFSRWLRMEQRLGELTGDIAVNQIRGTEKELIRVFEHTMRVTLKDLQRGGAPVNPSFDMLNDDQIKRLINSVWNDSNFSQRYLDNGIKIGERIKKDLADMLIAGKSPSELKKGLQHDLNMGYYASDRLVRTESNYFFNTAAKDSYRAAGVERVEYIAEQDSDICDECEDNAMTNGGIYLIGEAPELPVHPNCRCCYAPVVE